jgi:hypothetical protein
MTTSTIQPTGGGAGGGGSSSDLVDVVSTILDKGVVIDAHVAVGIVGIRLLTVDARVVVASVDTYLRFAEATNRLDLSSSQGKGLPDLAQGPKGGLVEKAGDALGELVKGSDHERAPRRRRREEG